MKIYIVDDEVNIVNLIVNLIDWERLGVHLEGTANSGEEAYEYIREHFIDVLIVDINMPGMDGLELIEKVRDKHPTTNVIVVSGYQHFDYAYRAIKFGAIDYLPSIL